MAPIRPRVVLALALGAAAHGCAAAPPRPHLAYADRARRDYDEAMDRFNAGDWMEAEEKFKKIRQSYGYSSWGWLAELRLADIDFKKDNFAQAIQSYRSFIRYHPRHVEVPYAHFMIAKSYFAQIPTDWFLVPSSWERDQSSTNDAQDHLRRFLEDYPESRYAAPARDLLRRVRELLARAEIHVAEFYLAHDRPDAAISRLQGVVDTYAGSGLEPDALLKIGEIHLRLGRKPQAHAAFAAVVTLFPRSSAMPAARRYLRFIGPVAPRAPAGVPTRGAMPPPPPPAES